jgi:hypothetical protein
MSGSECVLRAPCDQEFEAVLLANIMRLILGELIGG